jgi:hypothetical protein
VTPARTQYYDITLHKAVAGDTWEKLSKHYYGHERCSDAMRAFNMQHARASMRMRNEGTVLAGESIIIPPLRVLLESHGPLIRPWDSKSPYAPNKLPPGAVPGDNVPAPVRAPTPVPAPAPAPVPQGSSGPPPLPTPPM